jgi:hypothetical protein
MWLWMLLSVISVTALNTNIERRGVLGGLFLNNGVENNTPVCVNCKFFKNNFYTASKFGKCTKFPQSDLDYTLVDGISVKKKQEYYYCSTARMSSGMCGKEGKFYQDKREM